MSSSLVDVGATTVESIPNDNYSIHVIIMIVACFLQIFGWPANVKQPLAIGTCMR